MAPGTLKLSLHAGKRCTGFAREAVGRMQAPAGWNIQYAVVVPKIGARNRLGGLFVPCRGKSCHRVAVRGAVLIEDVSKCLEHLAETNFTALLANDKYDRDECARSSSARQCKSGNSDGL